MDGDGKDMAGEARFSDLAGRAAVVTGASRGIGRGIAEFLARQGAEVLMTSRDEEEGLAVVERLRGEGLQCRWVCADVATAEGARSVFDTAIATFGRVDVLVNNAAQKYSKRFLELDEELWHDSFERNVRMVYELSLPVARHMADGGRGGSIVNLSSVGGLRAHRTTAGYDASKGAIDTLTRAMALDLAPHGVRVNAVAPGMVLDAHHREHILSRGGTEKLAEFESRIPLGRAGRVDEIATVVGLLASRAGAYITGQVLYVDGGLTAQLTPPGIKI